MPDAPKIIPPKAGPDAAYWLGQAGFWIDLHQTRILIDPYLSDSLAIKYAGCKFAHQRMMPIPITPENLPRPDVVLITHAHTDHMDSATLAPLAARFEGLRFIVPAAELETARARIGTSANLDPAVVGAKKHCGPIEISVFPSAHETRVYDDQGHDRYLGYGLQAGRTKIYHSGDTVPFDLLDELIKDYAPNIAMLPVNGRDETRAKNGVPGNMTAQEALDFCQNSHIGQLIAHHFGLFSFNTASQEDLHMLRTGADRTHVEIPSPLVPIPLG